MSNAVFGILEAFKDISASIYEIVVYCDAIYITINTTDINYYSVYRTINATDIKCYSVYRTINTTDIKCYSVYRTINATNIKYYSVYRTINATDIKCYSVYTTINVLAINPGSNSCVGFGIAELRNALLTSVLPLGEPAIAFIEP